MKPAETGAPPPPSAFASRALTPSDEGIVREVSRRLAAKDGDRLVVSNATVPTPSKPTRAHLTTFSDLRRATQLAALSEWNSVTPAERPQWDLYVLIHYSPAPLNVDALHYLSSPQRDGLRERAEKDRRYVRLERQALKLMREIVGWVARAEATVASKHPSDGMIGPGMDALDRLLDPEGELANAHHRFAGGASRLAREDRARSVLAIDIPNLLRREATTRELALASLLFGLFPKDDSETTWLAPKGRTVAEAIDAECRLIDKAKTRVPTRRSRSTSGEPPSFAP